MEILMDRYWLVTWTCYGQWLSGDARGFVANIRDENGQSVRHNTPGTEYDRDMPRLENWMRQRMTGEPITLHLQESSILVAQFQETALIKKWSLEAASVMFNHIHLVVGVPGDPDPDTIRELFKSWATRALLKHRPKPSNGTFWTAKGSERKLKDDVAVRTAVIYVAKKQPRPLATWAASQWEETLAEYDRTASQEPETDATASRSP
jgi:REP element-mobilizing transposase RayT